MELRMLVLRTGVIFSTLISMYISYLGYLFGDVNLKLEKELF